MSLTAPSTALVRLETGIKGLDTILGGGVLRGGIYIVRGDPGAGKTILTNQICFNYIAGSTDRRCLFVTLLAESHARMIANLRTLSFFDEARIPDAVTYLSALGELRDGGLKALLDLLRREIHRRRCSVMVLDGLVSVQAVAVSELALKDFVHGLQEIALGTECTMFLTNNMGGNVSPEQTMVDGLIELSDRIYGWRAESDLRVKKMRGGAFLRGRHGYKITDDGIVVHPRIEALLALPSRADQTNPEIRLSSGNSRLDGLLGGGLPGTSTTMVLGPSGTGKTTLGMQFLNGASPEEPGLYFGFYETPSRLRARVKSMALASHIETGLVEVMWQPPTGDMVDAYGESLLSAIHKRKVRRLFIDGLNGFRNAASDVERMGNFFVALVNELRVLGVTTVYTLEAPDLLGPAARLPVDDVSSIAENMIALRFHEWRGRLHRIISILKMRNGEFNPSLHEFAIGEEGITIAETPDSAAALLEHDRGLSQRTPYVLPVGGSQPSGG